MSYGHDNPNRRLYADFARYFQRAPSNCGELGSFEEIGNAGIMDITIPIHGITGTTTQEFDAFVHAYPGGARLGLAPDAIENNNKIVVIVNKPKRSAQPFPSTYGPPVSRGAKGGGSGLLSGLCIAFTVSFIIAMTQTHDVPSAAAAFVFCG